MRHRENPTIAHRERYCGFRPAYWPERLREPCRWKARQKIATCFMGDLFAGGVLRHWQRLVFQMMIECDRHDYMVLTKRPGEMARFFSDESPVFCAAAASIEGGGTPFEAPVRQYWPPLNVWCGTSVSTQDDAIRRVPEVVGMGRYPWVSVEPILERVTLRPWIHGIRWVVVGGGNWKGAPMVKSWVEQLYHEAHDAGVAFWDKRNVLGADVKEWPTL